jgi:hypothetical protein
MIAEGWNNGRGMRQLIGNGTVNTWEHIAERQKTATANSAENISNTTKCDIWKRIIWRLYAEMDDAKAFKTFIWIFFLIKTGI